MKDREGANHHTSQPELAQPQEPHRYRVDHYGKSRNFAAYEGQTIIAVTLYRKGAAEIMARLEEKDRRIAALESQLAAMSESQVFPVPSSAEPVPAPSMDTAAATCPYCRRGHANLPHHLATPQTCTPQAPTLSRYTSCSVSMKQISPSPSLNG